MGFLSGSAERICLQCRNCKRHRFHPWVEMILWRKAWQLILAFLPGEPMHRGAWLAIIHRVAKRRHWSDSMHAYINIYIPQCSYHWYIFKWCPDALDASTGMFTKFFFHLINAVNPMIPLSIKPTLNQYKVIIAYYIFILLYFIC